MCSLRTFRLVFALLLLVALLLQPRSTFGVPVFSKKDGLSEGKSVASQVSIRDDAGDAIPDNIEDEVEGAINGLSTAAIIGIAVGAVVVVLVIILLCCCCCCCF